MLELLKFRQFRAPDALEQPFALSAIGEETADVQ
jgi:hypothetical protein